MAKSALIISQQGNTNQNHNGIALHTFSEMAIIKMPYYNECLQGRNRDTDVENKRMDTKGGKRERGVVERRGFLGQ